MLRRPAILAAIATAILWLCQAIAVHYLYAGNWTGLFCIASATPVPSFLKGERLYLFPGTLGYDGQSFHLMAHDPWRRRGSAQAIDSPTLRYQRILVPALAWMLALGRDEWIHAAYIGVILTFSFLGVFWLARLAETRGRSSAWGLAFLAVPATITSADRMTADVALAALVAGFALYARKGPSWRTTAMLAAALLVRETAGLVAAGYCIYLLSRRQFTRAIATAGAFLPAAAWMLYVTRGSPRSRAFSYLDSMPLKGLLGRVVTIHPLTGWRGEVVFFCDIAALAGIVLALALAAKFALARRWDPVSVPLFSFALAAVFLSHPDVWADAYNFGRVLSPLLLLVFLESLPTRPFAALLPVTLVDLRIALNIGHELEEIVHGLLK